MASLSLAELRFPPGGLLGRLAARAGRGDLPAQMSVAVAVAWLPFVALGTIDHAVTGRVDPLLGDLSVHVRLLVAVPLFLAAEALLAGQARLALAQLVDDGLVPEGRRAQLDADVHRAARAARSLGPNLALLVVALGSGVATLLGWLQPAGMVGTVQHAGLTAGRLWFGVVALPLFQFVLGRALWMWAIWAWMLLRLARLGLAYQPGHPDRLAGIELLALPSLLFHAVFLFATSCLLAASWGAQMWHGGAHLAQFRQVCIAYVLIGEIWTFAPLLVFTPRLLLLGRQARIELGALATDYEQRFRQRWMVPDRPDPLGSPDVQSLNDLGGAYRESAQKSRAFLFSPRELVGLLVAMMLPMAPLVLTSVPTQELLRKLAGLMVGAR